MIITTQTGSIYELDKDNKQVRRLAGKSKPTMRQAKDGEWQTYHDILMPAIGMSLFIMWDKHDKCTITSPIRTVSNDEVDNDDFDIGFGDVA